MGVGEKVPHRSTQQPKVSGRGHLVNNTRRDLWSERCRRRLKSGVLEKSAVLTNKMQKMLVIEIGKMVMIIHGSRVLA